MTTTPIAVAESIPDEVSQIDREEKSYESPSRLSGLRGMLFSIGLKNLGRAKELENLEAESPFANARETKPEPEPEPGPPPEPERAVISRTFTPFAEPVPIAPPPVQVKAASDSPKEVTTLPEFLPPKEFVPVKEGGSTREATSPIRADRRDDFNDLQTLPSRRGQYKQRG